jgi:hypothetical protein
LKKTSLETLLRLDGPKLQRAAAKLTHVGEQTEPIGTIVIQTYYYLPSLEAFSHLRTSGLSYANDELPMTLNFSITPQEFDPILQRAEFVWKSSGEEGHSPSLSFAAIVDSPEGVQGAELLFSYEGGVALHRELAGMIDKDNKIGQMVLERQRESAYAGT